MKDNSVTFEAKIKLWIELNFHNTWNSLHLLIIPQIKKFEFVTLSHFSKTNNIVQALFQSAAVGVLNILVTWRMETSN